MAEVDGSDTQEDRAQRNTSSPRDPEMDESKRVLAASDIVPRAYSSFILIAIATLVPGLGIYMRGR